MAPFDLVELWGVSGSYVVALLIGLGFGAVLEMSGFGDSRKLAGQFYLKDMTVLKVMFTGIIVTATLIFTATSLGFLDFDRVWVNPTYMVPGIVGGLVMGVGFVIGGFCPGTSVVAMSTLKIDGLFFVLGVLFGVFLFSESVGSFDTFWRSTDMGRFTLADLFGIDAGIVLLGLILIALAAFYGAEISEKFFGGKIPLAKISLMPRNRVKLILSAGLIAVAVLISVKGQPTLQDKWSLIQEQEILKLSNREVYVPPAEVLNLMHETSIYLKLLDVRNESDFNLFHLSESRLVSLAQLENSSFAKSLAPHPGNTVIILISNEEQRATQAWKLLKAQGLLNLYIMEGGINHWLEVYQVETTIARRVAIHDKGNESLRYQFTRAVDERVSAAFPELPHSEHADHSPVHKVKLQKKKATSGGCG
ncbi:MAG: YeeE/YedE family protein [SAR324 cluster bacterium]|nr:YeeE/YedE family protein [SAR324 cluster bacterium]